MRGVLSIIVYGIFGHHRVGVPSHRLAGVGIYVEPWEVGTGDVEADSVAGGEQVGRRLEDNLELVRPTRFQQLGLA